MSSCAASCRSRAVSCEVAGASCAAGGLALPPSRSPCAGSVRSPFRAGATGGVSVTTVAGAAGGTSAVGFAGAAAGFSTGASSVCARAGALSWGRVDAGDDSGAWLSVPRLCGATAASAPSFCAGRGGSSGRLNDGDGTVVAAGAALAGAALSGCAGRAAGSWALAAGFTVSSSRLAAAGLCVGATAVTVSAAGVSCGVAGFEPETDAGFADGADTSTEARDVSPDVAALSAGAVVVAGPAPLSRSSSSSALACWTASCPTAVVPFSSWRRRRRPPRRPRRRRD